MRFFVYFAVLLIAGGTVLFGMDWLSAPMSPMPPIKPVIVAKAPPPVPAAPRVETNVERVVTPAPVAAPPPAPAITATVAPPAAPAPIPPAAIDTSVPSIVSEAPGDSTSGSAVAEEKPQPKCDVNACTAAYRSFTAADCTYQPVFGPRRFCAKGAVPGDTAGASDTTATPNARAAATCNVNACAAAYVSFNAADCTYQPINGPRRLCER